MLYFCMSLYVVLTSMYCDFDLHIVSTIEMGSCLAALLATLSLTLDCILPGTVGFMPGW